MFWSGQYIFKLNDEEVVRNDIHNEGLNLLRDLLAGIPREAKIKSIAFGDNDSPIDISDTSLKNERFRKDFESLERTAIGTLEYKTFISDEEATFHIREAAVFCEDGTMISRILYDLDKSDNAHPFSFEVVRRDIIARGG
ncbi:hypothetical protein [Geomicrobium sediminis]|uniref:Uncharacterized protein n=1 Tax=Geomicrobium sediminis TaxID=1347788 RepID=A0ABS2PFH8_9BACL|nr:hypothetical protein [Geomicrobium sediminis]MBM7633820.1 hypothetical protein [Geomicrobium sediminis]